MPLLTALAIGAATNHAAADDHATCSAAFEASELELRPGATRLLQARESLRACALPTCQSWMIDDCTKRLVEVEDRIPSVVFSAMSGDTSIHDVRVVEGERELTQIDGRALELEPGPHSLVAVRADGARVSLDVVVIEGKRAQQIVFAFPRAESPAPARTVIPAPPSRPEDRAAHPWAKPVAAGLVAGAAIGTGIGVAFGLAAIAKKGDADCNEHDVCLRSFGGALADAHASTAAFITGGVLAAAGIATYLVFGRTRRTTSLTGFRVGMTW